MKLFVVAGILETLFLAVRLQSDAKHHVRESIALLLATGIFYLISCWLVLRLPAKRGRTVWIVVAAIVFRLTLWPTYPVLSDDVFRYRWEGKLQAAGGNPYEVRPNDAAWQRLRDETFSSVPGRDFRAVYGPLIELLEHATYLAVSRFEADPFRQAFWFKLPAAIFDLGVMALIWFVLKARGLPVDRVLVYAWAPLPIMEFWGNGHNDSVAVFFVLLALLAGIQERWAGAFLCLAVATASKIWPVLLFPIFMGIPRLRNLPRWGASLIALPVLALAAYPYIGAAGIYENARFMSGFLGGWRNNDSLFGILLWIARDDLYFAKKMASVVVCAAVITVTLVRWPLEKAVLGTVVAMLMVSANCHPWYLTWFLPLLAIYPVPPLLLWVALAPLAHVPVIVWVTQGVWNGSTTIRYYEYVPVYLAAGAWFWWRRLHRHLS